jgi:heme/copper-type cytochrome/quinol oxidase subunit 2
VLLAAGLLVGYTAASHLRAQDAPARREVTVVIQGGKFTPNRVQVAQDDLVTLIVRSEDAAHSFAVDEYRIARRVPAGGSTSFEFRADRPGTFPFYCNLTSEPGHRAERGELIVLAK